MNEICPSLRAEHFFLAVFLSVYEIVWVSGISCSCFFYVFVVRMNNFIPSTCEKSCQKEMPGYDQGRLRLCCQQYVTILLRCALEGPGPLLRMVGSFRKDVYVCVCTLRTFQGWNYSLLFILSRVMCFHPWSDVTLPLMSIDEILEVIREWIRQFKELSNTYRWVQVGFNLWSLFEWLPRSC